MYKLLIILGILLLGITTASCQKKPIVLAYGKLIDLSKIDWQVQELDTLFSKIVYSKDLSYKESEEIYRGEKPLRLQWVYKYNVDTTFYSNQLNEGHFKVIQPNENNLVVQEIYRSYVGMSNDTLKNKGPFGYYVDKSISFKNIETLSDVENGAERVKMVRLIDDYPDDKPGIKLLAILKEQYKDAEYKELIYQGGSNYEWKLENQVIKLSLSIGWIDDQEVYTVMLEKHFTNPNTLNNANQKETAMNNTNPIYELFIDAKGCYFEICINEIPVYFHYDIGATAFRLPINNYILASGQQSISLKMLSTVEGKPFPEGANVSLVMDIYPKEMPRDRTTVFTYKTPLTDETNTGFFAMKETFRADVPYELVGYENGVDLTKEEQDLLLKELGKIYREFTDIFKHKDLARYKGITQLRQENVFASLYYTEAQKRQAESTYVEDFPNETVQFHPLENYRLVFYGNGKLVGLQKPKDAPGIFIDNEYKDEAFTEYILFYRKDTTSALSMIF